MKTYTKDLVLTSNGQRVSYHNITEQVKAAVAESGINNGLCVVQSPHTTCSVIFEEYVHDTDFNGDEFLQVDLNRILDKIIPRELSEETNYRYPGPKHLEFLMSLDDPNYPCDPGTILNGDAHIRASLFGASETFILREKQLQIGSVGYIYFIDFDQNRQRNRKCQLMILGE
ncbi:MULTISPECIES: YjbQ family protein [unclassified Enterococcus]|uniref:YjbQ family protein n=1 Tax=unclassified Enterococcus TaxID=2608891 RepID=UPI001CE1ED83|nr:MULTISPECIES: YjbQ family protein [unclassified Enterococcus]MCA5012940.1 YjbQ family protein [Enterococcus sp. S23]MCA5016191.1 YjbQ family protein [Enterococcus sp. S22(2020)]